MADILIYQNLPNVEIDNTFIDNPMQVIGLYGDDVSIAVLADGGICQFFSMNKFSMIEITEIAKNLPERATLQIYRLVEYGESRYFICVKYGIDYSFLNVTWLQTIARMFGGPYQISKKFNVESDQALNMIESIRERCRSLIPCDICKNDVVNYLRCEQSEIKSNLALIRAGDDYYLSSFSVNNIATLPAVKEVIKHSDFLQVITLIRPSEDQKKAIMAETLDNATILHAISGIKKDQTTIMVHTMVESDDELICSLSEGVLYFNCKYLIRENSLALLEKALNDIKRDLNEHDIIQYHHTISGLNEYVTAFPGNGNFGELYQLIRKSLAAMLVFKLVQI